VRENPDTEGIYKARRKAAVAKMGITNGSDGNVVYVYVDKEASVRVDISAMDPEKIPQQIVNAIYAQGKMVGYKNHQEALRQLL